MTSRSPGLISSRSIAFPPPSGSTGARLYTKRMGPFGSFRGITCATRRDSRNRKDQSKYLPLKYSCGPMVPLRSSLSCARIGHAKGKILRYGELLMVEGYSDTLRVVVCKAALTDCLTVHDNHIPFFELLGNSHGSPEF